jgi:putative antitoxin of VapBC-like toxin-antitoxin system
VTDPPEAAMTDLATNPIIVLEIDEGLLTEAQNQLGGASPGEALNEGLRLLVEQRRARRLRALERTQQMADEGLLDFSKLDHLDR